MARSIFISLPVADVAAASAFYEAIGFDRDPDFSGDHAATVRWSDTISIMLADRSFYRTLTPKPIADAHATSAMLIALPFDTRAEVDAVTAAAIAAGGREAHGAEDEGFMYSRGFEDLDGNGFGPFSMSPAAQSATVSTEAA